MLYTVKKPKFLDIYEQSPNDLQGTATIYYRTVLRAQEEADYLTQGYDAREAKILKISKLQYTKMLVNDPTKIFISYSSLNRLPFGKPTLGNLLFNWNEYWEDLYV